MSTGQTCRDWHLEQFIPPQSWLDELGMVIPIVYVVLNLFQPPLPSHSWAQQASSVDHHSTPIPSIPENAVCVCVPVSTSHCSGSPPPPPSSVMIFDRPQSTDHTLHRCTRLSSPLTSPTNPHSPLIASISASQTVHHPTRTRQQGHSATH